ncbi:MAG: hypothetical protein ABI644_09520 [Arenimonas sp.]
MEYSRIKIMYIKLPRHVFISLLLLLACTFAVSCTTEPTVQADGVDAQQIPESPKPLNDIVVASEDEVPTWDESAGKIKSPSKKADPQK